MNTKSDTNAYILLRQQLSTLIMPDIMAVEGALIYLIAIILAELL